MIWLAVGLVVAGVVAVWGVVVAYQARNDAARGVGLAMDALAYGTQIRDAARSSMIAEMDWLTDELNRLGIAHVETQEGKRVLERGKA